MTPRLATALHRLANRLDPHPTREATQHELGRKAEVAERQRAERVRARMAGR